MKYTHYLPGSGTEWFSLLDSLIEPRLMDPGTEPRLQEEPKPTEPPPESGPSFGASEAQVSHLGALLSFLFFWGGGFEPLLKLDHGWPESITSQARSAKHCRMRSFSAHEAFVKQARDRARQGALRKLVGASWSAQVALRKLHCASCSAQVAPRKLLRQVGSCKWLPASCSVQIALPASCSVQAALCKLLCASCSA